MEKEELQNVIKSLQTNSKDAGLGFYYMHNSDGETYIKGNKAGLELFAAELLEASLRIEDLENKKVETLYLSVNKEWIENKIPLLFIQPVLNFKREEIIKPIYGWKDEVIKYGCFLLILIAVISAIIGIVTIIKWL